MNAGVGFRLIQRLDALDMHAPILPRREPTAQV